MVTGFKDYAILGNIIHSTLEILISILSTKNSVWNCESTRQLLHCSDKAIQREKRNYKDGSMDQRL